MWSFSGPQQSSSLPLDFTDEPHPRFLSAGRGHILSIIGDGMLSIVVGLMVLWYHILAPTVLCHCQILLSPLKHEHVCAPGLISCDVRRQFVF